MHFNFRDVLGVADMYGLEGLKEVVAFHLKRDWCHLFHKVSDGVRGYQPYLPWPILVGEQPGEGVLAAAL